MRCKKCKRKMRKTGTRWEQAQQGPIAGWDITEYECKCGHKDEDWNSVD